MTGRALRRILTPSLLSCLLLLGCGPLLSAAEGFEARLEALVDEFEARRQEMHVPGMALVVVKGDKVVLARGFGFADLDAQRKVTAETLFAIGSSTKSFTATVVGTLVDEGKMSWDDPVTRFLPKFQLPIKSDDPEAVVNLRDLLAHRTGFTRMGLLWVNGAASRQEMLELATGAEPWTAFRERFNYNNVTFTAAAAAAEAASGSSWEELVSQRLLKPLGMTSSTLSIAEAQKDPRLSLGYRWDGEVGSFEPLPMRNLPAIAPAGAINSNVTDMAQWLRFQLGRGEVEGKRLISKKQLEETWTAQIKVAEGIDYGLGWMRREWQGQPVVEHGGNIDGFSAQVALLPESDLGFVLLMNVSATPLQALSINMVWDTLVGEIAQPAAEAATAGSEGASDPFVELVGIYVGSFAHFTGQDFEVLVKEGKLAVDVPGQMVYEVKQPNEQGRRPFALTDTIAISFDRDAQGKVVAMRLHQGGMDFELPRKGVEIKPEIDPARLQRFLGTYRSVEKGKTGKVVIQNQRLAIDVPGQMVYELYPPDEEGKRYFRVTDKIAARFVEDDDGRVDHLLMYQNGAEVKMVRESEAAEKALPTLDQLAELRHTKQRLAAFRGAGALRLKGKMRMAQAGLSGTVTWLSSGLENFYADTDFGRFGRMEQAVHGDRAWEASTIYPFREYAGKYLEQAKLSHPASLFGDWREFYDQVKVLRSAEFEGKEVYLVQVQHGELPPGKLYVEAATGDVLKAEMVMLEPNLGVALPMETLFEDYREVGGLRLPFRIVSSTDATGRQIVEFDSVELGVEVAEDAFVLSPEGE